MAHRVSSRQLVGRQAELALLGGLVERAAAGEGGAALVTGEAGVGKSRLVAELADRARAAEVTVLVGECVDLAEAELPYAPVVAALRGVMRDAGDAELLALVGPARPELARLWPELGEPAPGPMAPGSQARLFELLLGVLSRMGRRRPVLLILEDLHWADAASLDLLGFLVRNQRAERLAIVVTLRDDELAPEHPRRPRLAELERDGRSLRIQLERMPRADVAAQAAEITGAPLPAAVVERLFDRAQGNPFFTEELLAGGVDGELPASLRDALFARVRRLGDSARRVIGVAAVAGRTVDHRLLGAVADLPERELIGGLREAVAHHVLVSDGLRYTFRHALLREAVYADLVAGQRAPVHAALAAALTGHPELAGTPGTLAAEVAHHWSTAGSAEPALAAAVQAGVQAERVYAVADARRHFEHALDLWERVEDPERRAGIPRSELLRQAADAVWLSGGEAAAVALAREALDEPEVVADPRRASRLHGRLATFLWGSGDSDAALEAARRAAELLPADPPTADRARALTAEGRMLVMRSHNLEARDRCAEALAVARAAGARQEEGEALNYLGGALSFLGESQAAIGHLREAVRILRPIPGSARGCPEYENLSEALADAGRPEEGLAVAHEGLAVARELGVQRSYGAVLLGRAALCALALGRVDEAGRLTGEAFDLAGESFFAFNALEAHGRYELLRGELAGAARPLAAAGALAERVGDLMWIGPIAAVSAELELWRGGPEQAVALVAPILALAPDRECPHHTGELHAHGARAHADVALAAGARRDAGGRAREAHAAAKLHERLEELSRRSFTRGTPPPRVRADIALCAAEAGRAEGLAPLELWRDAVAACETSGHRPRAAYARWRLAEAVLGGGDRPEAARVLAEALRLATELGHAPITRELQTLARRARIKVAGPGGPVGPAAELGLTPREVDVLALLADGRTNREIAAELYISGKTAEHHVSRILGKLGVRTRGAASAAAHRLGITAHPEA